MIGFGIFTFAPSVLLCMLVRAPVIAWYRVSSRRRTNIAIVLIVLAALISALLVVDRVFVVFAPGEAWLFAAGFGTTLLSFVTALARVHASRAAMLHVALDAERGGAVVSSSARVQAQ